MEHEIDGEQITEEQQKEWNVELKQHNERLMAAAEKNHRVKQELKDRLEEAVRAAVDAYPNEDGVHVGIPSNTNKAIMDLLRIIRMLERAKERVELSGQAVDEFHIDLPDWAELV